MQFSYEIEQIESDTREVILSCERFSRVFGTGYRISFVTGQVMAFKNQITNTWKNIEFHRKIRLI